MVSTRGFSLEKVRYGEKKKNMSFSKLCKRLVATIFLHSVLYNIIQHELHVYYASLLFCKAPSQSAQTVAFSFH